MTVYFKIRMFFDFEEEKICNVCLKSCPSRSGVISLYFDSNNPNCRWPYLPFDYINQCFSCKACQAVYAKLIVKLQRI